MPQSILVKRSTTTLKATVSGPCMLDRRIDALDDLQFDAKNTTDAPGEFGSLVDVVGCAIDAYRGAHKEDGATNDTTQVARVTDEINE